jgi:hypothetical protein
MQLQRLDFHPFLSIAGLPQCARPLVANLLLENPDPVEALVSSVAEYRARIEERGAADPRTNVALGVAIASALEAFLQRVDERTPIEELWVIHAAVHFFVIEDDGFGNDLSSEDGLFADARVVNAMLRWFGRDDLFIPLPVPAAERRAPPRKGSRARRDAA